MSNARLESVKRHYARKAEYMRLLEQAVGEEVAADLKKKAGLGRKPGPPQGYRFGPRVPRDVAVG